ncbi:hypothetical protein HAX54_021639 [Datura stramonium]|uniref:Uncharacterized protein n=1 Tax=Datura stramonium TaxID=4076 RepID=A0ABS8RJM2_DATST|nr:hypothetical protein [Datura stramonium]
MSSRPDTPTVTGAARIIPSRYRQTPQSLHRSSSTSNPGYASVSAAAKLLQEVTGTPINPCAVSSGDGAIVHKKLSKVSASNAVDGCAAAAATESTSCPNSPMLCNQKCKISSRLDTPTVTGASRVVPSRYKFTPQSLHRHCPTNNPGGAVSAADKLLREVTATPINPCAVSQDDGALISESFQVSTSPYVDSCATGTATTRKFMPEFSSLHPKQ